MSDASLSRSSSSDRRLTAQSAIPAGKVWQLADGSAGVYTSPFAASSGQSVAFSTTGQWVVTKQTGIQVLDGGRVYWSRANSWATYARNADRDFYLGRAVGDSQSSDTSLTVNLNVDPRYDRELARDPYVSALIGTPAAGGFGSSGGPNPRGGALEFLLAGTNEAEKMDALGRDGWASGLATCLVEMGLVVVAQGGGSAALFSCGIASGTHATAADSITQHLLCRLLENSSNIEVSAGDGTNTLAATATGQTFTTGSRFELWFDCRTPGSIKVYVNGVQVLSGSTINVSAAASPWYLLAHLVKSASTDTLEVDVDWLRVRFAEQRG